MTLRSVGVLSDSTCFCRRYLDTGKSSTDRDHRGVCWHWHCADSAAGTSSF